MNCEAGWKQIAKELSKKDKRIQQLVKKHGYPTLKLSNNHFQTLVEAILSQQLATKAAQSIIRRFCELKKPMPSAKSILTYSDEVLRSAGVSPQKQGYLRSLAEHWQEPKWRRGLELLEDAELIEKLTQVKGIGEWTAQMFLIFGLGRHNVLPCGDYGIQRGLMLLGYSKGMPKPKEIPKLVNHWEGGYSVGAWYVWRSLDNKKE